MVKILQVDEEIDAFANLLREQGVRSFLEIGSKFGGSLSRCARAIPAGSRIVSVDLPSGTKVWPQSKMSLEGIMAELKRDGYDTHLVWGNSQDSSVIEKVRELGPFDAIFIDGDHRLEGVTADWENYGAMGRIIGFHDISWRRAPDWVGVRIDVPAFWDEIKGKFRHEEFRYCPTGKNNGIGVLWRS